MKWNPKRAIPLILCFALILSGSAAAADGMPGDMGEMPMGEMPMGEMPMGEMPDMMAPDGMGGGTGDGAPSEAAIVIVDGAEAKDMEYDPEAGPDAYTSEDGVYTISGLELLSDDYTFNGIVVKGQDSVVRLEKSTIRLGVGAEATDEDQGGAAVSIDDGATLYVSDSTLIVDGAARYVTANYNDATLIVNNSTVQSTGSNDMTAQVSEPFSNEALLISGTARANFSIGATKTYYFNSVCIAEGWAALSTDSATGSGLDLYAYNTDGIAENGGYSTYADTNCRVWLYGSRLTAAEIGCIISKSGQIHVYSTDAADEDLLAYNEGAPVSEDSSILGGRNAVMIHAPDMMGQGLAAADCGTFTAENAFLGTTEELVSTKDYNDYGEAVGAYIDYVSGSVILIRSTSAVIDLKNVTMESYNGTLIHTVLNADSMGNFLSDGDGAQAEPVAVTMTDMDVSGAIRHEDYQRRMTVELRNTTLTGNIISGTMEDWNSTWADYGQVNWVVDENYNAVYGVALTLGEGSVWNVTGSSSLQSLTLEEGAVLAGVEEMTLDGEPLTPEAGVTYTGEILISGSYVPVQEESEETEEPQETAAAEEPAVEEPSETAMQESLSSDSSEDVGETVQETSGSHPGAAIGIVAVVVAAVAILAVVAIRKRKAK